MASVGQERLGMGPIPIRKTEQANAAPGAPDTPNPLEAIQNMVFGRSLAEQDPIVEFLQSGDAQEVRVATLFKTTELVEGTVLWDSAPNQYTNSLYVEMLKSRAHALKFVYPLFREWPDRYRKDSRLANISSNRQERQELVTTLTKSADLLDASLSIAGKVKEESSIGGDIDVLFIEGFNRGGGNRVFTDVFNGIFSSEATVEGFEKFGVQVNAAAEAFVEIGKGTALVKLENGRTKKVENIFSKAPNHGEFNWIMENYVIPRIAEKTQSKIPDGVEQQGLKEDWESYLHYNRRSAALLALLSVIKFGRVDLTFAWSQSDATGIHTPDPNNIRPDEIAAYTAQGGPLWAANDGFKLDIEARRKKEWGKTKVRGFDKNGQPLEHLDHMRVVGAPASLGCYPRLFANLFEVATFQIPVPETNQDKINRGYKTTNQTISVWDAWQTGTRRWFSIDNNGKLQLHEEPMNKRWRLDQIPWDNAMIVNEDSDDPYLEFAYGPNANTREIPYGLALMYGTKMLFDIVMRNDFDKVYGEMVKGDLLWKMNKAIDVSMGIIESAKGIGETELRPGTRTEQPVKTDTLMKLNNYVRTVLLASLAIALKPQSIDKDDKIEKNAIAPAGDYKDPEAALISSAAKTGFLPTINGKMVESSIAEPWRSLYKKMVAARECFLPGDIPKDVVFNLSDGKGKIPGIFDPKELERLKILYPFGLTKT